MADPAIWLGLGAATLGESGGRPMAARIKAAWPGARVAGPAFCARCADGDNLAIHVAVTAAPTGAVLVVEPGGRREFGFWGEVLTTAAEARGLAGLVIDGGVRDVAALAAHGFPVFTAKVALPGASKVAGGVVGGHATVGDVDVRTGDWIVGDVDGVVVVPADLLDDVLTAGRVRAEKEQGLFEQLRAGATTIELLDLDPSTVLRGE